MIQDELKIIEESINKMQSIGLINSPVLIYFKTPNGETMRQLLKSEVVFSDYSYNRKEYEFAIKEIEKLGININGQTFEQCVNSVIAIAKKKVKSKNVQPGDEVQCGVGKNNI